MDSTHRPQRLNARVIGCRPFYLRGLKVVRDSDVARAYGVSTGYLNRVRQRHAERFPESFAFLTTREEAALLNWRGRHRPWVFSEHGELMLAGLINTPAAIRVSIQTVRSFIALYALQPNR